MADKLTINTVEDLETFLMLEMQNRSPTVNAFLGRSAYAGGSSYGNMCNRDINKMCGYPDEITLEDYEAAYERNPYATKVVEFMPMETWKSHPTVFETEDADNTTPFEAKLDEIAFDLCGGSKFKSDKVNPLFQYVARADKLCGVGHYSVILLGYSDAKSAEDLAKPVEPSEGLKLEYLRVFTETKAQITKWVDNPNDRRCDHPEMYNLSFETPVAAGSSTKATTTDRLVHWSRVIHITDTVNSSEVFSVPRMRPVYNRLLNIELLLSTSAEGYFRGAYPGISYETHPNLGASVEIDAEKMQESVKKLEAGLSRHVSLTGMRANSLSVQVADPEKHIDKQVEAICLVLNAPKRVFIGSEAAHLASTQDRDEWNGRVMLRQDGIVTPRMIAPLIDRLIEHKVLPEPSEYHVEWSDLGSMTKLERAEYFDKVVTALAKYVAGNVGTVITEQDLLTKILNLSDSEVEAIIDSAEVQSLDDDEPLESLSEETDEQDPEDV